MGSDGVYDLIAYDPTDATRVGRIFSIYPILRGPDTFVARMHRGPRLRAAPGAHAVDWGSGLGRVPRPHLLGGLGEREEPGRVEETRASGACRALPLTDRPGATGIARGRDEIVS